MSNVIRDTLWKLRSQPWKLVAYFVIMGVAGGTLIIAIALSASFIIQTVWGWIIPGVFPKLVAEGYIAGNISLSTAFGIVISSIAFNWNLYNVIKIAVRDAIPKQEGSDILRANTTE